MQHLSPIACITTFSSQISNLSQSFSSLALGGGQSEEILFDIFPHEKLHGGIRCRDVGFDEKDMAYNFKVIKITGHVIWKYQSSSDAVAKLKLKRLHSSLLKHTPFGEVELANYDDTRPPDADGFIKQRFDINADSQQFWQQGKKGMFVLHWIEFFIGGYFCCICKINLQAKACYCVTISGGRVPNLSLKT